MINIRLRHHGRHGPLHLPSPKLILAMLLPNGLEIKVGPAEMLLQKLEAARVRQPRALLVVIVIAGQHPRRVVACLDVAEALYDGLGGRHGGNRAAG